MQILHLCVILLGHESWEWQKETVVGKGVGWLSDGVLEAEWGELSCLSWLQLDTVPSFLWIHVSGWLAVFGTLGCVCSLSGQFVMKIIVEGLDKVKELNTSWCFFYRGPSPPTLPHWLHLHCQTRQCWGTFPTTKTSLFLPLNSSNGSWQVFGSRQLFSNWFPGKV